MKIKRILFIFLQLVLVACIFAQNSYWRCGTIEEALEKERRFRMILSPGYGPSYIYSKHFLVHFDTTGPNITSFAYAESVSMYAESLWQRESKKLPGGTLPPDYAGPDTLYDIFIRKISSYDKIFSGESLNAHWWSLSYIVCDNNSFRSQTVIRFPLSTVKKVSILMYDQSGKLVKNFDYDKLKPQVYTLRWDGRDNNGKKVDPGIYFFTLKISGHETDKNIIFLLGDKIGIIKPEIGWKTTASDSIIKTKEARGIDSAYSTSGSIHPLTFAKREITSKATPNEVFQWTDSIYNYNRKELKKAPIENDAYKPDGAYALFATMGGYLATIIAIDGYLLAKGVSRESLPASAIFSAKKYEEVLIKIPNKGETLVSYFWVIYNDLFNQHTKGKWEVKKTNEAFDKVKFVINILREEAMREKEWR